MSTPSAAENRRLAVPYGRATLSPITLAQAASGLCDLLWLVDLSDPATANMRRMMSRFGTVVDLAGLRPESWADAVAPYRPAGILTFFDTNMEDYARLAQHLGLAFHTPEVAAQLRDKIRQREAFRSAGLPSPRSWAIPVGCSPAEVERVTRDVSYPAIFKPQYGNDSKLVVAAADAGVLRRLIDEAQSGAVAMIVEEYLADAAPRLGEGFANYLSVESLVCEGTPRHFAITGRFPPAEPFRETGFFMPSTVGGADRRAVLELASAAIGALGVTTGCLHTEIKFTPEGPRLIEVNGRLGGGIPQMFELATKTSVPRLAMKVALGLDPGPISEPSPANIGLRFLFQAPMWARRVERVEGLEEAGTLPGVRAVTLHRGPDSPLDWRMGNHDYVFSVAGAVSGYDAVRNLYRQVGETVKVSYVG